MDGITQKFNVYDFFNLVIAGFAFLIALGCCNYVQAIIVIKKMAKFVSDSNFLLIGFIAIVLEVSLIAGAFIQVIEHAIIKYSIPWEQKTINNCLNEDGIFHSKARTTRIRKKACMYLKKSMETEELTASESVVFFVHCVYYLHIKGCDHKTERLRETQSLSSLLACGFMIAIIGSVLIYEWLDLETSCEAVYLRRIFITYFACLVLCVAFWIRYIISGTNRIRMVLSIYDALTDENV